MFQEALQFRSAIVLYYNKQNVVKVIGQVPPPLTWHISQIVMDYFSPIVSIFLKNQSHSH
jgi:hypothetical protein